MEIKTEADSGDFNECPQYDVQSAGMFAVSNTILFDVICLHDVCMSILLLSVVVLFTFQSRMLHIRAHSFIRCHCFAVCHNLLTGSK